MKRLHVVVGMNFGSEAKGQLCGILARVQDIQVVCTAWSPNAGHTYVDAEGNKFISTMLASAMIASPKVRTQLIGPGSVVNIDALLQEVQAAASRVRGKTIIVHPGACIRQDRHLDREKELVRIGSTMKGSAAAVIEKIWRDPAQSPLASGEAHRWIEAFGDLGMSFSVDDDAYDRVLDEAQRVLIEGAQGFSLGYHTGFWPYTTSRDVSTAQLMADCRIPFGAFPKPTVWGVMRTYPIRVANRFDKNGKQVGTSGPCYPDQEELDWDQDLGRAPELTTVTRLPRRIFSFSPKQIEDAIRVCGITNVSLTFADYLCKKPDGGSPLPPEVVGYASMVHEFPARVRFVHWGPSERDIMGLGPDGRLWDIA